MEKIEIRNAAGHAYAQFWCEDNGIIVNRWQGSFGTQDNLRKGLLRFATMVEELNSSSIRYTRLITDTSDLMGSFDSSLDWINTVRQVKAGIKYVALVIPANIFSKLSFNDMMKANQDATSIQLKLFGDTHLAREWLKEQV